MYRYSFLSCVFTQRPAICVIQYVHMSQKLVSNSYAHCQLCKAYTHFLGTGTRKKYEFQYADIHVEARTE